MDVKTVLQSVNKAIGAVLGGGLIALLVGVHVIPAGVGNTLLSVLGAAAAVLGAFLAPSNKPINTDPAVPAAESGEGDVPIPADGTVDEAAEQELSGGTATPSDLHAPEHAAPTAEGA